MTKKKLHVAFVIDDMNGNGAQFACLRIIRSLLAKNYNVDLVLLGYRGTALLEIPEGVNLFILERGGLRQSSPKPCSIASERIRWIKYSSGLKDFTYAIIRYLKSLKCSSGFRLRARKRHFYWTICLVQYIKTEHPDIIHANLHYSTTVSILSQRMSSCQVPVIWAVHSDPYHMKTQNFKNLVHLIPDADTIHAVSQGVAESVVRLVPEVKNKVKTIFDPLPPLNEITSLMNQPVEHQWLSQGSHEESDNMPKVVLAVGRLDKQKNFTLLVRAFAMARSERNIRLIILGEGPQRKEIEELVESLNVNHAISMPGWVANPLAFMARADLFVLSSSYEGLSIVLTEALACGCPVVSTNCPYGPSEILEDGRWGRLVPVQDHEALAEAIVESIDEQPDHELLQNRAAFFFSENLIEKFECMFNDTIAKTRNIVRERIS